MTRVLALGQRYGGDDAVGLHAARALRRLGVAVIELADASALIEQLDTTEPVLVIDAVLASAPVGTVLVLDAEAIEADGARPHSSHGMSVRDALGLARVLHGERLAPRITVIGVVVSPSSTLAEGLGPEVAEALPRVVARVCGELGLDAGAEFGRGEG